MNQRGGNQETKLHLLLLADWLRAMAGDATSPAMFLVDDRGAVWLPGGAVLSLASLDLNEHPYDRSGLWGLCVPSLVRGRWRDTLDLGRTLLLWRKPYLSSPQ